MTGYEDNDAHIDEIIAVIQSMAAEMPSTPSALPDVEPKGNFNTSEDHRNVDLPLMFRSNSGGFAPTLSERLADLKPLGPIQPKRDKKRPSVLKHPTSRTIAHDSLVTPLLDADAPRSEKHPRLPHHRNRGQMIPRRAPPMRDTRHDALGRYAALAWPGLTKPMKPEPSTEIAQDSGRSVSCWGPLIGPTVTQTTSTQSTSDRTPSLHITGHIPGHMRTLDTGIPSLEPSGQPTAGEIRESTVKLLRPLLQQWLDDEMPSLVNKALHNDE